MMRSFQMISLRKSKSEKNQENGKNHSATSNERERGARRGTGSRQSATTDSAWSHQHQGVDDRHGEDPRRATTAHVIPEGGVRVLIEQGEDAQGIRGVRRRGGGGEEGLPGRRWGCVRPSEVPHGELDQS